MCARSVGKALAVSHTSLTIIGYIQERSLKFVVSVGEAFVGNQTSSDIRGHIQKRHLVCTTSETFSH